MIGPIDRSDWGTRKARWYSEGLRHSNYADEVVGVMEPVIRSADSLLDVGAGCGALCIPLARLFGEVVAVDSSVAMIEELVRNASSAGVANIRTELSSWEAAEGRLGEYDVVLCANVPGVLDDPADSIPVLERHARRFVFLVLSARKNSSRFYFDELWPLIHGTSPPAKQDYFEIYSALHSSRILANVVLIDYHFDQPFRSIDEAILFWKDHMKLAGSKWDDTLCNFLAERLEKSGDLLWARVPRTSAVLWWKP